MVSRLMQFFVYILHPHDAAITEVKHLEVFPMSVLILVGFYHQRFRVDYLAGRLMFNAVFFSAFCFSHLLFPYFIISSFYYFPLCSLSYLLFIFYLLLHSPLRNEAILI